MIWMVTVWIRQHHSILWQIQDPSGSTALFCLIPPLPFIGEENYCLCLGGGHFESVILPDGIYSSGNQIGWVWDVSFMAHQSVPNRTHSAYNGNTHQLAMNIKIIMVWRLKEYLASVWWLNMVAQWVVTIKVIKLVKLSWYRGSILVYAKLSPYIDLFIRWI